jgi:hypothetical protein
LPLLGNPYFVTDTKLFGIPGFTAVASYIVKFCVFIFFGNPGNEEEFDNLIILPILFTLTLLFIDIGNKSTLGGEGLGEGLGEGSGGEGEGLGEGLGGEGFGDGSGEGLGEGLGDGSGEGLGEGLGGEGLGDGLGDGLGEGLGEGLGDGSGDGSGEGLGEGLGLSEGPIYGYITVFTIGSVDF